jgi:hypothetical protein
VYATYLGPNRLYRNDGQAFPEVAQAAGVADESWSSSAAFGDLDSDGLLDLYVANYVAFDVENPPSPDVKCPYKGLDVFCGPGGFTRQPDRVYANAGAGRFIDKSAATGLDQYAYPSLGVVFGDLDADGDLDIYVANDTAPNLLLRNDGAWQLTEVGIEAGVAFSGYGKDQAGMGVHSGDFDRDGRLDLFVTNFSNDVNTLYRNEGTLRFTDATYEAGLGGIALPYLGWGTGFFDFDNDGWLDLYLASTGITSASRPADAQPERPDDRYGLPPEYTAGGLHFAYPDMLYHNERDGSFRAIDQRRFSPETKASMGFSTADFDRDGRVDFALTWWNEGHGLFQNSAYEGKTNNWIAFELEGGGAIDRDAIGTRVTVVTDDGLSQMRELKSGSSLGAGNEMTLHFGLGDAKIDRVIVSWLNGAFHEYTNLPLNQRCRITWNQMDCAQ